MRFLIGALIPIFISAMLVVGYYEILPWFYGQQFAATRRSQPYVTTVQTGLLKLQAGYYQAATDEQRATIVAQMCQQAALVQPDQVPAATAQFLAGRCPR